MHNPAPALPLQLSIVIPSHNESENLKWLIPNLVGVLSQAGFRYELIIVNDHSTDETPQLIERLSKQWPGIKMIQREGEKGFGRSIRKGFEEARGDVVIPFMGDASDNPLDIPKLYHKILEGHDIVYGSRFIKGGSVKNYPFLKLIANRVGNFLVRWIFRIPEKDISNALKAFRREALMALFPLEATEFNISLELAIKAHLAGLRRASIPVSWEGRTSGVSNFKLKDLTHYYRDYLFTLLVMLAHAIKQGGRNPDSDGGSVSS